MNKSHVKYAIEPSAVLWVNLGNTLEHQGNWGAAIAAFQSAIGLDSRCSPAFVGLASVHEKTGIVAEAIASLKQAIEIDPSEPAAYCNLGAVYCRQGDWQNAIGVSGEPLRWHRISITPISTLRVPGNVSAGPMTRSANSAPCSPSTPRRVWLSMRSMPKLMLNSRMVFVKQSCYQESIAHSAQALEIDPRMLRAINILGVALQKQGRLEEAIERYRQALNVDPDFAVGHSTWFPPGRSREVAGSRLATFSAPSN